MGLRARDLDASARFYAEVGGGKDTNVNAGTLAVNGSVAGDIVHASDNARESAERSRKVENALEAIEQRSTETVNAVDDIARAAEEQSRAGHDIAHKVEAVAHLAETIGRQTREVDRVAGDLSTQVAGLADASARFRA